jgi:Domain of unknown function DUF29
MGATLKNQPEETLYDQDFHKWAQQIAEAVRSGQISPTDREHIAEELLDMAKRDEHSLRSWARNVIHHLLKWQYQPEGRCTSWRVTIVRDRTEIEELLDQSPSLEYRLRTHFEKVYDQAVRLAIADTGLNRSKFPTDCPYTCEQVLDHSYFPDTD